MKKPGKSHGFTGLIGNSGGAFAAKLPSVSVVSTSPSDCLNNRIGTKTSPIRTSRLPDIHLLKQGRLY